MYGPSAAAPSGSDDVPSVTGNSERIPNRKSNSDHFRRSVERFHEESGINQNQFKANQAGGVADRSCRGSELSGGDAGRPQILAGRSAGTGNPLCAAESRSAPQLPGAHTPAAATRADHRPFLAGH